MAEGRVCPSPGSDRTNQILLGPCASNTCRCHFNSLIGGANSYGNVRNENLLGRLPAIAKQLGNWEVNPDESAEERRDSLAVERRKGIDEENSDCG